MSRNAQQGIRADPQRIVGFISGGYRGTECLSCGARRLGVLYLQCVTAARARIGCRLPAAAAAPGRTANQARCPSSGSPHPLHPQCRPTNEITAVRTAQASRRPMFHLVNFCILRHTLLQIDAFLE
ncbi:unnamed protein product [Pieris macdunnoughi]|uniref:Uncharacterized protein n=1 Tax=Pieris macdunnoughi TaxID=345717 RepID=A0A821S4J4_9NEOP|nr:unnamed protein product [Pieris macdunnoughi]